MKIANNLALYNIGQIQKQQNPSNIKYNTSNISSDTFIKSANANNVSFGGNLIGQTLKVADLPKYFSSIDERLFEDSKKVLDKLKIKNVEVVKDLVGLQGGLKEFLRIDSSCSAPYRICKNSFDGSKMFVSMFEDGLLSAVEGNIAELAINIQKYKTLKDSFSIRNVYSGEYLRVFDSRSDGISRLVCTFQEDKNSFYFDFARDKKGNLILSNIQERVSKNRMNIIRGKDGSTTLIDGTIGQDSTFSYKISKSGKEKFTTFYKKGVSLSKNKEGALEMKNNKGELLLTIKNGEPELPSVPVWKKIPYSYDEIVEMVNEYDDKLSKARNEMPVQESLISKTNELIKKLCPDLGSLENRLDANLQEITDKIIDRIANQL